MLNIIGTDKKYLVRDRGSNLCQVPPDAESLTD